MHVTDCDPLLFWLALTLTIIALVQTGLALVGPEEPQDDMGPRLAASEAIPTH